MSVSPWAAMVSSSLVPVRRLRSSLPCSAVPSPMEKEVWSLTVTVPSVSEKARSTVPMKLSAGEKDQPSSGLPASVPAEALTREREVMESGSASMSV